MAGSKGNTVVIPAWVAISWLGALLILMFTGAREPGGLVHSYDDGVAGVGNVAIVERREGVSFFPPSSDSSLPPPSFAPTHRLLTCPLCGHATACSLTWVRGNRGMHAAEPGLLSAKREQVQTQIPARLGFRNSTADSASAHGIDDDKPATAKKFGFYLHVFVSVSDVAVPEFPCCKSMQVLERLGPLIALKTTFTQHRLSSTLARLFYLQNQPAAVIHQVFQIQKYFPRSPIYIMSDGGDRFDGLCEKVGRGTGLATGRRSGCCFLFQTSLPAPTHSHPPSLIHSLLHSLTHSLAHSLAPALTHALSHSNTHARTRSLAHSLTRRTTVES